ncbi:metallophosphoesterase [Coleofasciculus sp.]|uniref:metallophosphoesterase n=1 Tax=Coleofasciculus sp. TaxID=3100458 RepID=UPI003A12EE78
MVNHLTSRPLLIAGLLVVFIALAPIVVLFTQSPTYLSPAQLLSDPFLQLPTDTSVRVVWFTEFAGTRHSVAYGKGLKRIAIANTTKLSRSREDQKSRVGEQTEDAQVYQKPTLRDIWRHEAEVTELTPGTRVPYQVTSVRNDGQIIKSNPFTLAAAPPPDTPLKILLTSDHQLMPMTAANLQKVAETVGKVDAIFLAGDLVNIPDRASEWFDDNRGGAFFPALQGHAHYQLEKNNITTRYTGGELIQHAPLFPATGNHEVMGRFSTDSGLNDQFNDPIPRQVAAEIYQQMSAQLNSNNPLIWLKYHSFNTDTYNEIFTLPGKENYYAITFGDIHLISLYITNIWRTPSLKPNAKGRYREREADLNDPTAWGYGQHIFEPIKRGSPQYNWLQAELNSPEFQQAKYKIVMFHHPPHSLGDNIVPPYTDPVQTIERDRKGTITAVRYDYPPQADYIIRDVIPLLETAGVQLVLYGHSHLWNRFVNPQGIHFLESSNVGNTYGAYLSEKQRQVPEGKDYAATGDPSGLEPILPTIAPLRGEDNQPLPYISSNDITVFSILDTSTGIVSSYRFDTTKPDSDVIKFDEFQITQPKQKTQVRSQGFSLTKSVIPSLSLNDP